MSGWNAKCYVNSAMPLTILVNLYDYDFSKKKWPHATLLLMLS